MDGNTAMNSEFENMSEKDMEQQPTKTPITEAIELMEKFTAKNCHIGEYGKGVKDAFTFLMITLQRLHKLEKEIIENSYEAGLKHDGIVFESETGDMKRKFYLENFKQ